MFINFEFGNFKSFRDIQTFSMKAATLRKNDNGLNEQGVIDPKGLRLLRTKAIYGGNGSGKSNFTKAIVYFNRMVYYSVKEEGIPNGIWANRFRLISDWDDQPIFFQYTFSIEKIIYRYGFRILKGAILDEWLFSEEGSINKEYFFRKNLNLKIKEENFPGSGTFMQATFKKSSELFRKDSLFLTAAALNGNKFASDIRLCIQRVLCIDAVTDTAHNSYALKYMDTKNDIQKKILKKFIIAADTGIEDLELVVVDKKNPEKNLNKDIDDDDKLRTLYSIHSVYNENGIAVERLSVPFSQWESGGTKKFLGIGVLVSIALNKGAILIIDELDAQLHPNLTLKIVQLFNIKKTNPKNAQLIFITHDTSLLKRAEFRRDQICIVDKDKYGISSMRSLIEFKGVRKDSSYEKDYLSGVYSGVPFLDEIDIALTGKP